MEHIDLNIKGVYPLTKEPHMILYLTPKILLFSSRQDLLSLDLKKGITTNLFNLTKEDQITGLWKTRLKTKERLIFAESKLGLLFCFKFNSKGVGEKLLDCIGDYILKERFSFSGSEFYLTSQKDEIEVGYCFPAWVNDKFYQFLKVEFIYGDNKQLERVSFEEEKVNLEMVQDITDKEISYLHFSKRNNQLHLLLTSNEMISFDFKIEEPEPTLVEENNITEEIDPSLKSFGGFNFSMTENEPGISKEDEIDRKIHKNLKYSKIVKLECDDIKTLRTLSFTLTTDNLIYLLDFTGAVLKQESPEEPDSLLCKLSVCPPNNKSAKLVKILKDGNIIGIGYENGDFSLSKNGTDEQTALIRISEDRILSLGQGPKQTLYVGSQDKKILKLTY